MASESSYPEELDDGDVGLFLPAAFRDPIVVLKRQFRWVAVTLVVLLIATATATSLYPLVYHAEASILLTSKNIPDEFVPTTIIATILEQFEAVSSDVFSRRRLATIISETGIYEDEMDQVSINVLAARLRRSVNIERISKPITRGTPSSIAFSVEMKGSDPQKIADVVNRVVADLIDVNLEYRSRQARVTTEFMQNEFNRADKALRSKQRELANFRAQNRGALPEEQETAISKLERLEDQRRSAILQLSEYRSRLERLDARPQSAAAAEDPTLKALRDQLESTRAIYTDEHPSVLSLERQLASMLSRKSIETPATARVDFEEYAAITKGMRSEQNRLRQIDDDVAKLDGHLSSAPRISEDYAALVREEQILEENYVEYLRKLKNAELALSLESSQQGAQLNRLDSAIPPASPVRPRWMIAATGILLSLGLAPLLGFARELLFPVIIDEQHLEDSLSIPCIGSIKEFA